MAFVYIERTVDIMRNLNFLCLLGFLFQSIIISAAQDQKTSITQCIEGAEAQLQEKACLHALGQEECADRAEECEQSEVVEDGDERFAEAVKECWGSTINKKDRKECVINVIREQHQVDQLLTDLQ